MSNTEAAAYGVSTTFVASRHMTDTRLHDRMMGSFRAWKEHYPLKRQDAKLFYPEDRHLATNVAIAGRQLGRGLAYAERNLSLTGSIERYGRDMVLAVGALCLGAGNEPTNAPLAGIELKYSNATTEAGENLMQIKGYFGDELGIETRRLILASRLLIEAAASDADPDTVYTHAEAIGNRRTRPLVRLGESEMPSVIVGIINHAASGYIESARKHLVDTEVTLSRVTLGIETFDPAADAPPLPYAQPIVL